MKSKLKRINSFLHQQENNPTNMVDISNDGSESIDLNSSQIITNIKKTIEIR